MTARDTTSIAKCGFKNGDMLHVGNQNAVMASAVQASQQAKETAKSDTKMIDTSTAKTSVADASKSDEPKVNNTKNYMRSARCTHPTSTKCINCIPPGGTIGEKKESEQVYQDKKEDEADKKEVKYQEPPSKKNCRHGPN